MGDRGPVRLVAQDRGDHVGLGFGGERRPPAERLIEDAAEGPDVGAAVEREAAQLLGAHVARRPEDNVPVAQRRRWRVGDVAHARAVGEHLRDAEVEDLHAALGRDLDVGRLQIAMDDAALVRRLERQRDLMDDRQRLIERQRAGDEPHAERFARHQLHLDDAALLDLAEAEQHRDVRMIERRQHARFALEARPPIEIRQERVVQHLERDLPSELCVFGTKNFAHST